MDRLRTFYIVTCHYIGPLARYDGSGNTDHARVKINENLHELIQWILCDIVDNAEDEVDAQLLEFCANDLWEKHFLNFKDTYMYHITEQELLLN